MKQVLIRSGRVFTSDLPTPDIQDGEVLVRLVCSSLSTGTELSSLRDSSKSLARKVLDQPKMVSTAIRMVNDIGLRRTTELIAQKRAQETPSGYSASGVVVRIGNSVSDLSIGDRVACAGAQYAYHAEYIKVSRNLCVPIPTDVDFESASTVALGAIAIQGLRRAQPTLGESFVVIGLGIIGQITCQLLKANGCRVIGIDRDSDRIEIAKALGIDHGFKSEEVAATDILQITAGFGADGVIVAASARTNDVIASAFKYCRRKGRVVLIGDVGLDVNREDIYQKEIDFLISTSYGPGRYDSEYEQEGKDYPIGYVRWTENRNMEGYLDLIKKQLVNIRPLVSAKYNIEAASDAYSFTASDKRPLLVLLSYPNNSESNKAQSRVDLRPKSHFKSSKIRIAVIGAGSFAREQHLPNLIKLKNKYLIKAIVNSSSSQLGAIGRQFGAEYISTSADEVLNDSNVDAVIVSTRHNLHGQIILKAIRAGKHVLVEKPTVINRNELSEINDFVSKNQKCPIILTGFNRRFSPYAKSLKEMVANAKTPFILTYRINGGYLPKNHWVHGPQGGGRNVGEACHIYDLFTFLADSEIVTYSAHSINPRSCPVDVNGCYLKNDNFVAVFSFANGSVANLVYSSMGNHCVGKEYAEMYVGGKLAILQDFKNMTVHGAPSNSLDTSVADKGLVAELEQFAHGIDTGLWPIPWWQQMQVAEMAFQVEDCIVGKHF